MKYVQSSIVPTPFLGVTLERCTIERPARSSRRSKKKEGKKESVHIGHQSIRCQGLEFKNLEHITNTSGRHGQVERWGGKGVQLERNADCKCQLKANAGRGGRGYGELTRVSRTYLRCQSKSQPGNLSRRVDVAATVTMVTLKLPCWFRHGANSLRDFGRTQSKLLG